jgi:HSP20 family protein
MAKRDTTSETGREQNPTAEPGKQQMSGAQQSSSTEASSPVERERNVAQSREPRRDRNAIGIAPVYPQGISPFGGLGANPFVLMRRMIEDMDRTFGSFGLGRFGSGGQESGALWSPQVELFEREKELVVRADLPGLSKDDVDIEIDNGVLTISGERRTQHEENRGGIFRSERSYGAFTRNIPLPEGVEDEQCNATFKDGVLEVTFPKAPQEERRARRVEIK